MQLLLHDDCLVNFLEKGVFGGIAASLIDCLHHGRRLLLDTHGNPLLLLLHHLVLVVVLGELGPETSEDLILVGLVLEHLHEIFHAGKVVEHCHTVVHDFLLGHAEVLKPGKCVFDSQYRGIGLKTHSCIRLRDHGRDLCTRLAQQNKAILVRLILRGDLLICSYSHIDLVLVIHDTLLVLLVSRVRRRAIEFSAILLAQLHIFSLLRLEELLALVEHVKVYLLEALSALNGLSEVLCRTFSLELLDLGPNSVWHVIA